MNRAPMNPRWGITNCFWSSQQIPRLCYRDLKGSLSAQKAPQDSDRVPYKGPSLAFCKCSAGESQQTHRIYRRGEEFFQSGAARSNEEISIMLAIQKKNFEDHVIQKENFEDY